MLRSFTYLDEEEEEEKTYELMRQHTRQKLIKYVMILFTFSRF